VVQRLQLGEVTEGSFFLRAESLRDAPTSEADVAVPSPGREWPSNV
jgi:hypothetical protein